MVIASLLGVPSANAAHQKHTTINKITTATTRTTSDINGVASWYGKNFKGRLTYNEERFDPQAMTCASRTIPMQSVIEVTNLATGKSVICRVNDRGPYVRGRFLDLSDHAAHVLGVGDKGLLRVRIRIIKEGHLPIGKSNRGSNYVP